MANKSNSENQSPTIDDIINEIKKKIRTIVIISTAANVKKHSKISSALYREYFDDEDINIDFEGFDLRAVQRGMLNTAKKHVGEPPQGLFEDFTKRPIRRRYIQNILNEYLIMDSDELEILTELQHYGGTTNLIDFTTDYLIAIFFACA